MRNCFRASVVLLAFFAIASRPAYADSITRAVTGTTDGGQHTGFNVTIDFTRTGGDFSAGTGTATVKMTLENTSGLYPFQTPALGNPILTAFYFNVIPGATVSYTEARVLAGSSVYSTGTTMLGVPIPAGCVTLTDDEIHTDWYEMQETRPAGQYGFFTNSLETEFGVKAGMIDPDVLIDCVPQGDIFSPLVIAGQLQFTMELGNLDLFLDSAADFLNLCSVSPGGQQSSSLAGKFQATDENGEGSAFAADEGNCQVPVQKTSWGAVKEAYH